MNLELISHEEATALSETMASPDTPKEFKRVIPKFLIEYYKSILHREEMAIHSVRRI